MTEQKQTKSVGVQSGWVEEYMREAMHKISEARKAMNKMSFEFNDRPNEVTALYDVIDDMLRAADSLIERGRINLHTATAYQQRRAK